MARNYTGQRNNRGERTFTSDSDGDRGSNRPQQVDNETRSGGSSRVKSTYEPKSGRFK